MDENEKQYANFDEALQAAQEQISTESLPPETEEQTAENSEAESDTENPVSEPTGDAELEPVRQSEPQNVQPLEPTAQEVVQQLQLQNQQLQMQNQQMQGMLQEMSRQNQAEAEEEALTPPTLDVAGMWMEDENVIRQKQQEYAQQMAEYTKKRMERELAPLLETAKQGLADKARQDALNELAQVPELAGIMGMTPTLEKIIQSNPVLANADVPIEDKLITAYAIARGADTIKNPPQPPPVPTADDFMQMYEQSPELQKRVEAMRVQKAADAGNAVNVPPMSASAGAFNAALTTPEKPKDFEEARRLVSAKLGWKN